MRRIRVSVVPTIAVIALAAILTGCTGAGSNSGIVTAEGSADYGMTSPEFESGTSESGMSDSAAGLSESAAIPGVADRQVVTTGTATITVEDPIAAAVEAVQIVEGVGGRVDSRTEQAPVDGNTGRASVTLRIPSTDLSATLEKLKALGEVVSVNTTDRDVTTESQDLDARITALSTSVDRLLGLLSSATDTSVLIELETAISSRQGELDSLQSQRRLLSDQVTMSALTLELVSAVDAPAQNPNTFVDALLAGLTAFGTFFTGLFLVFGFMIPWIVLLGVGVLLARFIVQRRRAQAKGNGNGSATALSPSE